METSDQSISESYDNMGDEDGSLVLSSFSDDSSVSEEERASKRRKTEEGFEGTFKDPTRDEMTMFKETENLFKSSLFNLQLTELLKEARPDSSKTSSIEQTLKGLKKLFVSIPSQEVKASEMQKKFPGLPLTQTTGDVSFTFHPPEDINLVGSFQLNTQSKSTLNVDVAVVIPRRVWKKNDYHSHCYFHKRALYMAVIAKALMESTDSYSVDVKGFRGDTYKPYLEVVPYVRVGKGNKKISRFAINIFPVVHQLQFEAKKLLPTRGNLKDQEGIPTPFYNNAIVEDMMMDRHLQLINACTSRSPSLRDAIVLFKLWLHQRGMKMERAYSFSGFLMSMYLVHLVQQGHIHFNMSPYDIFSSTLRFLHSQKWRETGIFMNQDNLNKHDIKLDAPLKEAYLKGFPIVFVDPSGRLNLTSRMTKTSFDALIQEVDLTIGWIYKVHGDCFTKIFITPSEFNLKYDAILTIEPTKTTFKSQTTPVSYSSRSEEPAVDETQVLSLLSAGYSDRITLLSAYSPILPSWKLSEPHPKPMNKLTIGLIFAQEEYKRLVDKGPDADNKEALNKYKEMWGDIVEIRRFRGGQILASLVWTKFVESIEGRHKIITAMAEHLLRRHFPSFFVEADPKTEVLKFFASQLDSYALTNPKDYLDIPADSVSLSSHGVITEKWSELSKYLQNLRELPLAIQSVENVSATFKYTEPRPPLPHPVLSTSAKASKRGGSQTSRLYVPAMEGLVQLVSSGSWPSTLEAIGAVKAAFYLAISRSLKKQFQIQSNATYDFVDVFYSGYVFRLYIFYPREVLLASPGKTSDLSEAEIQQLLNPQGEGDGLEFFRRSLAASPLYRSLVARRQMVSIIHGFHLRYPSYGPCARVAFQWLSAHMFDQQLAAEVVELLVAAVYSSCDGLPYARPNHFMTGFQRFLRLLSTWDWQNEPLVIDFDGDLKPEDYHKFQETYEKIREGPEGKSRALFIGHARDFASVWTQDRPTVEVWGRIVSYAKQTYEAITKTLLPLPMNTPVPSKTIFAKKWSSLFRTSTDPFDVLIKLNSHALPRLDGALVSGKDNILSKQDRKQMAAAQKKFARLKNIKNLHGNTSTGLLINFDPSELYFKELQERFKGLATFYMNNHGSVIGMLWMPTRFFLNPTVRPHAYFSLNAFAITNTNTNDKKANLAGTTPNIFSVLAEIQTMGEGLVDKIEVQ